MSFSVGMHECVTCSRCACTYAAVHPACPRCSESDRLEADLARTRLDLEERIRVNVGLIHENRQHTRHLSDRSALEKSIVGAIRSAIDAHGPVTKDNASSAGKRAVGAVYDHFRAAVASPETTRLEAEVCEACGKDDDGTLAHRGWHDEGCAMLTCKACGASA